MLKYYLCDFSSKKITGRDMAVTEFSDEVCALGAFTTGGSAKDEHNLGVAFEFNSGYWHSLLSNFPDSLHILGAINLQDELSLLVKLYNCL
jgi:hypothetical protein